MRVRGDTEAARVTAGLSELGDRDVQSVLLEGGPYLAGALFDAGEIDAARIFIAPVLAGGGHARGPLDGQGVELISQAKRALATEVETIDGDVLVQARFTEW